MRTILLTASFLGGLLFTSFNGLAQQKSYRIFYDVTFEYKLSQAMIDSLAADAGFPGGSIPANAIKLNNSLFTSRVEGNQARAVMTFTFGENSSLSEQSQAKWADSFVYQQPQWKKYKNGVDSIEPISATLAEKTTQTKRILGYNCTRFNFALPDKQMIEAWVCTDLPGSLTPMTGFDPAYGAILEVNDSRAGMHYIASAIKQLD